MIVSTVTAPDSHKDGFTPTSESLVKYGTAFEVPADQTVFGAQMYSAQNLTQQASKTTVHIHGCVVNIKDLKYDPNNIPNDESQVQTMEILRPMCTPRNKEGNITKEEMQNILNAILPPKEWTIEKRKWRQLVSHMPATRSDIISLQERLDMYLKQRRSKETGLCPIRFELYSQLFDELIRQSTITCIERGLLLVRIRNEMYQTIREYENLFASSTSCAIRKALFAETTKVDMESKIESTLARIEKKKCCLGKLERIYAGVDKKNLARFETIKAKHAKQVKALKESNQVLKTKLENIILPKKSGMPQHET